MGYGTILSYLSGVVYTGDLEPEGSEILTFFIWRNEIFNVSEFVRHYRCLLLDSVRELCIVL